MLKNYYFGLPFGGVALIKIIINNNQISTIDIGIWELRCLIDFHLTMTYTLNTLYLNLVGAHSTLTASTKFNVYLNQSQTIAQLLD